MGEFFAKATLVFAGFLAVVNGQCLTAPTNITNANYTTILNNLVVVYTCNTYYLFSTNDTALVSKCINGAWTAINANCVAASTSVFTQSPPCSNAPPTPANATIIKNSTTMVAFQCNTGMAWLSGEPVRITQCRQKNWTEILDICDTACPIPRHCEDVASLGLTNDGEYLVIPSGSPQGQIYPVFCNLNATSTNNGGNWTIIFNNTVNQEMKNTSAVYQNGVNLYSSSSYFVGLNFLSNLSLPDMGNKTEAMTLDVVFFNSINKMVAYSTYDNFSVGPAPRYTLQSLGKYHGNAGDGFCPHLNTDFVFSNTSVAQWWGASNLDISTVNSFNGSFLTISATSFASLSSTSSPYANTITRVLMRIRPTNSEIGLCPTMVGLETWWQNTTAVIPYNRTAGTIVTWSCIGSLFMEGKLGSNRTHLGTSTCQPGSPPKWSYSVTLPCTVMCPPGFNLVEDILTCVSFSNNTASGIVNATQQCLANNSTLALVLGNSTMDFAMNNTNYFTTYAQRGYAQTALVPPFPSPPILNCTGTTGCKVTQDVNECTIANNSFLYENVDCDLPSNYVCQIPGWCPSGYINVYGACYNVSRATNFTDALLYCANNGSSLAFPTSRLVAQNLANFLNTTFRSLFANGKRNFFIGLNNANGSWNWGTDYALGDIQADMQTSSLSWRIMTVFNASYSFVPVNIDHQEANGLVICQYHGPIRCGMEPPEPLSNMTIIWNNATIEGTNITYECSRGYFVNGTITVINQTVTCLGMLGGWYPFTLLPCIRIPVCQNNTPTVNSTLITNITTPDSYFLDGNITFNCPMNMGFSDFNITKNATCSGSNGIYNYTPSSIPPCPNCLGAIQFPNATTSWTNTSTYAVNSSVSLNCSSGFESSFMTVNQTITCTKTGWNFTAVQNCTLACMGTPPAAGANLTASKETANDIGTILNYTCAPGYYFQPTLEFPNVLSSAQVVCNASGVWDSPRTDYNCTQLCVANPPLTPAMGNTTWDNFTRLGNTQITYTCNDNYLFGNYSAKWVVTCNGTHWDPVNAREFICKQACMQSPPASIGSAPLLNWTAPYAWVNQKLNYTCPIGTVSANGTTNTTITCQSSSNWTAAPSTFNCTPACSGAAPPPPLHSKYNYSGDYREGVVVSYNCSGGFAGGLGTVIYSNCSGGNWTIDPIPVCLTVTTTGPSTTPPKLLPTVSPYSLGYKDTTIFSWSDINAFNSTNGTNNYVNCDGPLGFGSAIGVRSAEKQCMVNQNFVPANSTCIANPANCPAGLSFSIWDRPLYSTIELTENYTPTPPKYIVSTGADTDGRPGIAIIQQDMWLMALVSEGQTYWLVKVLGPLENDTWSNIGVRWNRTAGKGIELFVNLVRVGWTQYSSQALNPSASPFKPPTLLIGCQATSSLSNLTGFNDADVDELAIWPYPLSDQQLPYFEGGYVNNLSSISLKEILGLVSTLPLTVLSQVSSVNTLLQQYSKPTATELTAAPTYASTAGTTSTQASPFNANQALVTNSSYTSDLVSFCKILASYLQISKLPPAPRLEDLSSYLGILNTISNLLMPSRTNQWNSLQASTDAMGSSQLLNQLNNWEAELLKRAVYSNDSRPYCFYTPTDVILSQVCKMLLSDMKKLGQRFPIPNYKDPIIKAAYEKNGQILYDKVAVPTNVYSEDECNWRPISYDFRIFYNLGDVIYLGVNEANMDPSTVKFIDSKVVHINVIPDIPTDGAGLYDSTQPLCYPEPNLMQANPLKIKLEHIIKKYSLRQLKFHEYEIVSDINTRTCVWWNANLSAFGAWDASGCMIIDGASSSEYTTCACDHFGTFAIIAEQVESIEVPTEPSWLAIVRYIFYAISALAIIIYIVIVLVSGDLKDQFHLIGLNLAFALLFGSLCIVISEFDSVGDGRHLCVTFGTLVHFFYGAVGIWMFALGHAAFRAITAGIIGGYLRPYMLVCWGMALALIGIPFVLYLHDLGTDPRCFIGWPNNVKYIFFVPQIICCIMAVFYGFVILCNLSTPALRKDNLIEDYGSFARGAAILLFLLSITWTFGFLTYVKFGFSSPDFYPIFQVMNSLSGLCLFIFIGVGSHRFRVVMAGQAHIRRKMIKEFAFGLPDNDNQALDLPTDKKE